MPCIATSRSSTEPSWTTCSQLIDFFCWLAEVWGPRVNLKRISNVCNIDSCITTDGSSPAWWSICLNHHCRCEIIPQKAKLQPSGTPVSAVRCIVVGWAGGQGNISALPPTEDVRWVYISPHNKTPAGYQEKRKIKKREAAEFWTFYEHDLRGSVYFFFYCELHPCVCVYSCNFRIMHVTERPQRGCKCVSKVLYWRRQGRK